MKVVVDGGGGGAGGGGGGARSRKSERGIRLGPTRQKQHTRAFSVGAVLATQTKSVVFFSFARARWYVCACVCVRA
jgi:hypothetical protein